MIITISSGISSTYNSALQAQRLAGILVHVIDSKANSLSQGWEVLAAARTLAAGGSVQDIINATERIRRTLVTILHVNTLEYLYKGGRIGRAAMWIGTALNLKPQLYVDHTTGRIEPGMRSRSKNQAVENMCRVFFRRLDTTQPLHIGIVHGNVQRDAELLAERIQNEYHPVELMISLTSPMMGVHTGPGAMALCGYSGE